MNVQDLKNNRARIINKIKRQNADVAKVMTRMANEVTYDSFCDLEPLMKNIDKLTEDCLKSYFRHDHAAEEIACMSDFNRESGKKLMSIR